MRTQRQVARGAEFDSGFLALRPVDLRGSFNRLHGLVTEGRFGVTIVGLNQGVGRQE